MAKGITELIADFKELHPCAYKRIRDTAIDEFKQELLKHQDGNVDTFVWCSDINRIAKQMKEGGKDA